MHKKCILVSLLYKIAEDLLQHFAVPAAYETVLLGNVAAGGWLTGEGGAGRGDMRKMHKMSYGGKLKDRKGRWEF